jgi:hypothetical protein
MSSGFAKPCIVFCVKNGPCWCAAVFGVLVLNASASFFFIFSPFMRGLVLGKHTGRFSALRVYVSYVLNMIPTKYEG